VTRITVTVYSTFHSSCEDYGDSLLYVSQQLRLLRGVPLHSRLWAGFAGCQRAAEPALEHCDPFRPPQWVGPLDPGRRRIGRHGEKCRKIRDQCGDYGDSLLYVSQQLCLLRGVPLHSRLWAGFAGCQRAAEPALEHRDPFRPPQRAADRRGPLDAGRRRRVGRRGEKRREIGDQRAQRRHRCELVILARELRPSAGPWPIFGTAHQPRDHRIERDVTRRRQQMSPATRPRPPASRQVGMIGRWT
jgi:hypothetical protein